MINKSMKQFEPRENLSKAIKSSKKVQCPYCAKIVDVRNAARWHFDNCKGGY